MCNQIKINAVFFRRCQTISEVRSSNENEKTFQIQEKGNCKNEFLKNQEFSKTDSNYLCVSFVSYNQKVLNSPLGSNINI